jgi:hypothetical protein
MFPFNIISLLPKENLQTEFSLGNFLIPFSVCKENIDFVSSTILPLSPMNCTLED